MSLVLNVEILGEFKNLTAATKGAQTQLQQMNARASKVSAGITKAFAAIGVGFSLGVIKRELEEAGKAAAEDAKSQALLAKQLENTTGANAEQIKSVEAVIKKLQLQASVADDQLRPAYAKLVRSTKDTEEANKLLAIALDVSAGSGKSLDAVAQAMAKSVSGSDTALVKLLPSVKGVANPMEYLAQQFKGAASEAANTDPYQRMQIIFAEMQEQIGMALLPTLNQFSTWLATPEGQEKLQGIIDLTTNLIGNFTTLLGWVVDNKEAFLALLGVFGTLTVGLKVYNAVQALTTTGMGAMGVAAKGLLPALTLVITALETIKWLNSQLDFSQTNLGASGGALNFSGQSSAKPSAGGSNMTFTAPKASTAKAGTTVNVNVKTINDAKTTIKNVAQFQKATGTTLAQALK